MPGLLPQAAEAPLPPVLLQARGLRFCAGGRALIDGVDLTLRAGSRTVILGPNGAGKSLLLRLLHGLIAPDQGRVTWNDQPLSGQSCRDQAMVFQRPVLLRRSVLANLRFALKARGIPRADRAARALEALDRARLTDRARSPARVLSGGEQQRLALAVALAGRPRMLLLDEPTASLDPASTDAVERMMAEANATGIATVMVTHDAGQARRVGDDLVFLQDGRIAEAGPVSQLLDHPRSRPLRAWTEGRLWLPKDGA
ncbi:ATP-binding cassette domain-containing protein [Tropicibacter oceani]|uniref:ATP-binding cassette domain-containing protein n=1 Tax=Tropicibacter oceani TaxID=3058420 RepID=A0ABY8QLN2_9RHOB|nr:ATP-binding cassette domain-containing protein [Tropicibacter oceani]WGW05539.1 ATP-binding cassette domain-containing protein [Tropicibacter oceani]